MKNRLYEVLVSTSVIKIFKLSPVNYVCCLRTKLIGISSASVYEVLHMMERGK